MSLTKRQQTCAACGAPFAADERPELEALIDSGIRYLAVHPGHSTHPPLAQCRVARLYGGTSQDGGNTLPKAA